MTQNERRELAHALAAIDVPHPLLDPWLRRRRRFALLFMMGCCAVLAGWIAILVLTLPGHTGSVADAEDIVQEVFLRLTRVLRDGASIASPKAYLATATTRLAISYLRSARVRRESYVGAWLPAST